MYYTEGHTFHRDALLVQQIVDQGLNKHYLFYGNWKFWKYVTKKPHFSHSTTLNWRRNHNTNFQRVLYWLLILSTRRIVTEKLFTSILCLLILFFFRFFHRIHGKTIEAEKSVNSTKSIIHITTIDRHPYEFFQTR